ncbi:ParB N-terminal domain-containing protein [Curtobacterium sp. MCBD17_040]|uniref:ParB N-terminal domain-containing protein n=1 Tax=Curtobacterium sp. MCBD17_040 TaxID=2175674 RepID=UPI000DA7D1EE|nr:ParB N-terminal domain-containing protein [Curtobacterium sp. MCBD17_040]WIB65637.1 ParB N-terminal domain-containing protein [Curtobacterium sp. MCBD17_040]
MTPRLEMLVSDVIIGDRARGDLGDLTSLKRSITELGLLQPIGVRQDGTLVFGERRLAAHRELGLVTIGVVVTSGADDELTALRAEMEENVERLQFTAVEAATLRRRLRSLAAAQRQEARERPPAPPAPRVEGDSDAAVIPLPNLEAAPRAAAAPSVADLDAQLAQATGYSVTTLKRVERIAEFTTCGDPDTEEMARDAIKRIDAGAPVMPLLERVLAVWAAATTASASAAAEPTRTQGEEHVRVQDPAPAPQPQQHDAPLARAADDAHLPPATTAPLDAGETRDQGLSAIDAPPPINQQLPAPEPEPAQPQTPAHAAHDGDGDEHPRAPLFADATTVILEALPFTTAADRADLEALIGELEAVLAAARNRLTRVSSGGDA